MNAGRDRGESPADPPDPLRLLHELQVHQVELEAQNEELRHVRTEAEAARERYAQLYELAPVGYFSLDAGGYIVQVNIAGAQLLGYLRPELTGRSFTGFAAPADRGACERFLGRLATARDKEDCELSLRKGDGSQVAVHLEGRIGASRREFLVIAEDVTERRRNEQMLIEAKAEAERANKAKSSFLANMSHEIRTPLHIIVGLGHLLRRDLVDPVQRQRLDQLCANSSHLLALINDILDLSRIEAGAMALDEADFRLGALVERILEVIAPAAREKNLTLTVDVAPSLRDAALRGDALRLAQVLINLGNNAVKFTAQGTVRFTVESRGDAGADRLGLLFSVQDTGIGIAATDQARLFSAFSQIDNSLTRPHGGSGLGLAISQRIVKLMGGVIAIESSPGVGSTFSFAIELPRATQAPTAVHVPTTDLRGRRVLFAEDQPIAQEILLEMIEDFGCDADVAADGAEALLCAQERPYDLILMDMQMPNMDGLVATRAIRELPQHRDTPIIALTANALVDDRQRCLDAGMNGHIAKPVTPTALAAVLHQWLPEQAGRETPDGAPIPPAACPMPDTAQPDMRRTLLRRFIDEHGGDMERLRVHLAAGERDAACTIAHNLKGIAGLVGDHRVAAHAADLHTALRLGAEAGEVMQFVDACTAALKNFVTGERQGLERS